MRRARHCHCDNGKEANDTDGRLAASIIHHVQKNLQPVSFNRGDSGDDFSADPYIENGGSGYRLSLWSTGETRRDDVSEYPSFGTTFAAETMEILNLIATQTTLSIGNSPGTAATAERPVQPHASEGRQYRAYLQAPWSSWKRKDIQNGRPFTHDNGGGTVTTPQQLSEFLNDRLNMNFNTFINKPHRRGETDTRNEPDCPITSIAHDLGFNTISVFTARSVSLPAFHRPAFARKGASRWRMSNRA